MLRNYRLEILAGVAVIAFIGLFQLTALLMPGAEFAGSDSVASGRIAEISGIPEDDFQPLIPQWAPPSGEIESGLFALQAAIGGIVLGYVFGSWRAQRRQRAFPESENSPDTNV